MQYSAGGAGREGNGGAGGLPERNGGGGGGGSLGALPSRADGSGAGNPRRAMGADGAYPAHLGVGIRSMGGVAGDANGTAAPAFSVPMVSPKNGVGGVVGRDRERERNPTVTNTMGGGGGGVDAVNGPHGSSSQGMESLRDGDAAAVVAAADRRNLPDGEKPRRWGEPNGPAMGGATRAVAVGDGGRGGGHRAN